MPKYLIQFVQQHEEFRLPELEALATIEDVKITYDPNDYSLKSPFLIVEMESEVAVKALLRRAMLIKHITELWATGDSWDDLATVMKSTCTHLFPIYKTCSFKFTIITFGSTIEMKDKGAIINKFAFTDFQGKIELSKPEQEFILTADYDLVPETGKPCLEAKRIFMGRLVGYGQRGLIDRFNVKKRKYIGNTTMDAELSLIMANQALVGPGKLVYDPFVGTGSFLMTCAHFGAMTIGSDIDGRQIRGKGKTSIRSNAEQYGLQARVLGTLVFDVVHSPWRKIRGGLFDAIVTDPPYGVRAGAKTLGRKDATKQSSEPRISNEDGSLTHLMPDYVPPTKPYEMSEVVADLLMFAVENLTLGGRLVYWLPTVTEDYKIEDLPTHPCMELVANSEQAFGQWSRRLITMEKIKDWDGHESLGPPTGEMNTSRTASANSGGHFGFRDRYFAFNLEENAKRRQELRQLYRDGGPTAVATHPSQRALAESSSSLSASAEQAQ